MALPHIAHNPFLYAQPVTRHRNQRGDESECAKKLTVTILGFILGYRLLADLALAVIRLRLVKPTSLVTMSLAYIAHRTHLRAGSGACEQLVLPNLAVR